MAQTLDVNNMQSNKNDAVGSDVMARNYFASPVCTSTPEGN